MPRGKKLAVVASPIAGDIAVIMEALANVGARVDQVAAQSILKSCQKGSNPLDIMEIDPGIADEVDMAISTKSHTNLVGPPGCGKSTIKDILLESIHPGYRKVQCYKNMDVEEILSYPVVSGGSTPYVLADFALAMRDGIPVGMEEVDSLDNNRVFPLFPVLGPDRWVQVKEGVNGMIRIEKHKDFFVVATSNTNGTGDGGGRFAGTEIMNAALADRFSYTINVDYLKPDQELKVLVVKTGIDEKLGMEMIQLAKDTRDRASDPNEPISALSTRRLIAWALAVTSVEKLGKRASITKAAKIAFINRAPVDFQPALSELVEIKFAGR